MLGEKLPLRQTLRQAQVAFTGKLGCMTREEAHRVVREAGGKPVSGVGRSTSMLVVGMLGWPLWEDGRVSKLLQRAEELQRQGQKISITSEAAFLEMAGLAERRSDLQKSFEQKEVCELLNIQPETLRRWEQFSLVRSHDGKYDFQDLVSLQTIGHLVKQGVRHEVIAGSLRGLASVMPGTDRPLAQLKIIAEGAKSILAEVAGHHLAPDGQFQFSFERKTAAKPVPLHQRETAEDWFARAQVLEESEKFEDAAEAYAKALWLRADFPEACFNLGNVLRVSGAIEEAKRMYERAVKQDPRMACAWYNLADLESDRGNYGQAVESLRNALELDPTYANAHFNLALCLEKLGRRSEAAEHWGVYLELDPDSSWAEVARGYLDQGGP